MSKSFVYYIVEHVLKNGSILYAYDENLVTDKKILAKRYTGRMEAEHRANKLYKTNKTRYTEPVVNVIGDFK